MGTAVAAARLHMYGAAVMGLPAMRATPGKTNVDSNDWFLMCVCLCWATAGVQNGDRSERRMVKRKCGSTWETAITRRPNASSREGTAI